MANPAAPRGRSHRAPRRSHQRLSCRHRRRRPRAPELEITIKGDSVGPNARKLDIAAGDPLLIRFDTDRGGQLHVHSKPEQYIDFPDGRSSSRLVIKNPGLVKIEVGGGSDLPISAGAAAAGGALALIISFAILSVAWRTPRYAGDVAGLPVPWVSRLVNAHATMVGLRLAGVAWATFLVWCLAAGPDNPGVNPAFGFVYVLFWVGLVPASIALVPRVVNT